MTNLASAERPTKQQQQEVKWGAEGARGIKNSTTLDLPKITKNRKVSSSLLVALGPKTTHTKKEKKIHGSNLSKGLLLDVSFHH
eukprot:scaffold2974_cov181-Amphora_coffeaeformis.AAC.8